VGYEVDVGYFPQDHHEALGDPDQAIKSALWEVVPTEGLGVIMGRLAAVLFSKDDVDKRVKHISGGEAARVLFARLGAQQNTVMVLDEPTNHLDIESIRALAPALKKYDGTLLFVSHDRWFTHRVATRVIEIRADGITDFHGSYGQYASRAGPDHLDRAQVVRRARDKKKSKKKSGRR